MNNVFCMFWLGSLKVIDNNFLLKVKIIDCNERSKLVISK